MNERGDSERRIRGEINDWMSTSYKLTQYQLDWTMSVGMGLICKIWNENIIHLSLL